MGGQLILFSFLCSYFCLVVAFPPDSLSLSDEEANEVADQVEFYLYNDESNYSREAGRKLDWKDETSLKTAGIQPNVPLIIFTHGFLHNYTCMYPQQLKDAYFSRGIKSNFVAVDWGKIAQPPGTDYKKTYPKVLKKIPIVAEQIRNLIVGLRQIELIDLNTTHMIGFSLGAHISGHAGEMVGKDYPEKIARFTALDPAGPFFHPRFNPPTSFVRPRALKKTDARFVMVVHTDMADTFWSQVTGSEYGTNQKLGHADFFMNGGLPPQPGCRKEKDAESKSSCSHSAAPNYFMQTVGTDEFGACRCVKTGAGQESCEETHCGSPIVFGDNTPSDTKGNYHVGMEKLVEMSKEYTC